MHDIVLENNWCAVLDLLSGQTCLDTAIEVCGGVGGIVDCGGVGGIGIVDCGGGGEIVDSGGGECEGGGCVVTWEGIRVSRLGWFRC